MRDHATRLLAIHLSRWFDARLDEMIPPRGAVVQLYGLEVIDREGVNDLAPHAVRVVFLAEGLLIGFLAWLAGVTVSLPISKILSDALGQAFVQRPLAFTPALDGIGLWLAVVAVLAVVASLLPAWRATRLAVREVLAYE